MKAKRTYILPYSPVHMDIVEKTQVLSAFPMFLDSTISEVQKFAEKMNLRVLRPMEVFVEEDMDDHQAFFIFQGAVSVFRTTSEGEIINIDLHGAPELVGEMGLIDSKPSAASAMAIEETHALVLNQSDFNELVKSNPMYAVLLLKVFADKTRYFDVFLEHLLSNNLYERTWYLLQCLGQYFPNNEIALSQEQLDDLIWGTRSRINEVLITLEKEGKIEISRRKIKLL